MGAKIKHIDFPSDLEVDIHVCREAEPRTEEHAHDFLELGYILSGSATHHLGDGFVHPVLSGDIFLIDPGALHYYSEVKNLKVCYLLLSQAGVQTYLGILESREIDSPVEQIPSTNVLPGMVQPKHLGAEIANEVETILDRIALELETRQPRYQALVRALLTELFVLLSRLSLEEQSKSINGTETDINLTRISKVKTFIEEHYASDLRIADIARCASLAPQYLCRLFKNITGTSMIEYLTNVRIHQACILLRQTSLPITEICYRVGFNDLSHFIRTFRKTIDFTPSKYRKMSK